MWPNYEYYYFVVSLGILVPVFVHYVLRFIRENWHDWRIDAGEWLLFARANYRNDIEETRRLIWSRNRKRR